MTVEQELLIYLSFSVSCYGHSHGHSHGHSGLERDGWFGSLFHIYNFEDTKQKGQFLFINL